MNTKRVRSATYRVVAAIVGLAVAVCGNVNVVVRADEFDFAHWRQQAVMMLGSGWTYSEDASVAVLKDNSEQAWKEFAQGGFDRAQRDDLIDLAMKFALLPSARLSARASELVKTGAKTEDFVKFFESGWEPLKAEDDRERVQGWVDSAPVGSSVERLGKKALAGSAQDISNFADSGHDQAVLVDERRAAYAALSSPFELVRNQAREALDSGDPDRIHWFVAHGQAMATLQAAEVGKISDLVDVVRDQSNRAVDQSQQAFQRAEVARRAADAAVAAMQRARKEAERADEMAVKTGELAARASELADQAARTADIAVEAAADANDALMVALDALSVSNAAAGRVAQMASRTRELAGTARENRKASDDALRSVQEAYQAAGVVGDNARYLAQLEIVEQQLGPMAEMARKARAASDEAGRLANEASNQAGITEAQRDRARAAAARASAAAQRAGDAADRVDGYVAEIRGLLAQARGTLDEAMRAARAAGDAAAEAGGQAAVAEDAAKGAEKNAAASHDAVKIAQTAFAGAQAVRDEYEKLQDDEVKRWGQVLAAQAEDAAKVEREGELENRRQLVERQALVKEADDFVQYVKDFDTDSGELDVARMRSGLVALARVGEPSIAKAAMMTLALGDEAALWDFVDHFDKIWDSSIRNTAVAYINAYGDNARVQESGQQALAGDTESVEEFVKSGFSQAVAPELRKTIVLISGNQESTQGVKDAANRVLSQGTPAAYEEFLLKGGLEKAKVQDYRKLAFGWVNNDSELGVAASAAVKGDRQGLVDFVERGQYTARSADQLRKANSDHVSGLLSYAESLVNRAQEAASGADRAAASARQDAERARAAAEAADRYAQSANQSVERAKASYALVEQSLARAVESQKRARAAAERAAGDAASAQAAARRVEDNAVTARMNADAAQSYADQARSDAEAAEGNLNQAKEIHSAMQRDYNEMLVRGEEAAAGSGQGESDAEIIWRVLKDEIGPEAVELLKDLLGVNDVLGCMKGEVSGCLMTALNALPVGKLWKAAKALPLIGKLARSVSKVADALRAKRISRFGGACVIAPAARRSVRAGFVGDMGGGVPMFRMAAAGGCEKPSNIKAVFDSLPDRVEGTVFEVHYERFTDQESRLFQMLQFKKKVSKDEWALDDRVIDYGELKATWKKVTGQKFEEKDFQPIFDSMKSKIDEVQIDFRKPGGGKPYDQLTKAEQDEFKEMFEKLAPNFTGKLDATKGAGKTLSNKVSRDRFQNDLARNIAGFAQYYRKQAGHDPIGPNSIRINRRDIKKDRGKSDNSGLMVVSTGRPDLVVARDGLVSKYEFGSYTSNREISHFERILAARWQETAGGMYEDEMLFMIDMPVAKRRDQIKGIADQIGGAALEDGTPASWTGYPPGAVLKKSQKMHLLTDESVVDGVAQIRKFQQDSEIYVD